MEVLDRYTVRMYTKRPIIWFPAIAAMATYGIVAPEHAEGDVDYWRNQPIGSGPLIVRYSRQRDKIEYEAHRQWHYRDRRFPNAQLPFLAKKTSFWFADYNAVKSAFRTKQIDYTVAGGMAGQANKSALDDLLTTNPDMVIQVTEQSPDDRLWFRFQHRPPSPLRDIRLRRAISMAIDRRKIVDTYEFGAAMVAIPIPWPFLGYKEPPFWSELDEWHQYNPDRAKQLLAEAGYRDGFDLKFLVSSQDTFMELYDILKNMLAAVGVRLIYDVREQTDYTALRDEGKFEGMVRGPFPEGLAGPVWPLTCFSKTSPRNYGGYEDARMEEFIEKALYTLDADEQVRLLKEINNYAMDQVVDLEVYSGHYILMMQPWLHNMRNGLFLQFRWWASWQWGKAWLDDTAPAGRGGTKLVL